MVCGCDVGGVDGGDDWCGVFVGFRGERAFGIDVRGVRVVDYVGVGGGDELCDRIGVYDVCEGVGCDCCFCGNGYCVVCV